VELLQQPGVAIRITERGEHHHVYVDVVAPPGGGRASIRERLGTADADRPESSHSGLG
jgi:hypothetical protein